MAYGFLAKNEHGIVLSSQQKSFVFIGYYTTTNVVNNVHTFTVPSASWQSIYGVRLAVGGQGAVISVVDSGSGFTITVLGSGVLGILVFSPIMSGGHTGYGLALFNAAGECTFDSTQKPLVPTASGNLSPGVSLTGSGDTVIYIGAGIYASSSTSVTTDNLYKTYSVTYYSNYYQSFFKTRVLYTNTTTTWSISRNVALRQAGGVIGATLLHVSGSYTFMTNIQRWQTYAGSPSGAFHVVSQFSPYDTVSINLNTGVNNLIADAQAHIAATNTFPYATGQYNTTQNHILLVDSGLYL